ncbi:MAG: hypothetical protein ACJ74O_11035 [Frankiaceae bacterium]
MSKYHPLTELLREAAARGQETVELSFDEISVSVGGLPRSAVTEQWWANNSHVQALAWRAAGFHVEQVYVARRRARFAQGARGGSYADRGRMPAASRASRQPEVPASRAPVGEPVDVRVRVQWFDGGVVTLDAAGKPTFGRLEEAPGLYRMTLTVGSDGDRPRVYIGETDNLRRRLAGNYRNPGPSQQTSRRVNAILREHLTGGGSVALAIATTATVDLLGEERRLDLTRKAGRLLADPQHRSSLGRWRARPPSLSRYRA